MWKLLRRGKQLQSAASTRGNSNADSQNRCRSRSGKSSVALPPSSTALRRVKAHTVFGFSFLSPRISHRQFPPPRVVHEWGLCVLSVIFDSSHVDSSALFQQGKDSARQHRPTARSLSPGGDRDPRNPRRPKQHISRETAASFRHSHSSNSHCVQTSRISFVLWIYVRW